MEQPQNSSEQQNQLALRVALQTMKERCLALQRRLTAVEEEKENQQMREGNAGEGDNTPTATTPTKHDAAAENFQLRLQIAELNRQKTQLNEHINMVSNENRKLWSRLSQMAKEQGKVLLSPQKDGGGDCALIAATDVADETGSPRGCGSNQNLIRSKTFTQHSPNPHLRHKMISSEETEYGGELKDISLEEIGLDVGSETGTGEVQYPEAELGFAYLNVVDGGGANAAIGGVANEGDFTLEAKKCIDGLQDMRREALKQRQALNAALTVLETKFALHPCPECAQKSQKPEMADKSLETDDSIGNQQSIFYNNGQIMHNSRRNQKEDRNTFVSGKDFHLTNTTLLSPSALNGHKYDVPAEPRDIGTPTPPRLNIIQEKIDADAMDKTCPMCGKIYSSAVTFNAFREHVEMHFIENASDAEASMDRQFEFVSHAVGDF